MMSQERSKREKSIRASGKSFLREPAESVYFTALMTHEQILPASAGEALFRVFDRIDPLPSAPLRLDCLVPAPQLLPEDYAPPSSNKILSESTKLGRNQKRTYAAMLKVIRYLPPGYGSGSAARNDGSGDRN